MKETSKMLLLPWPAFPLFWGSSLFLKGSKQTTGNHHSQLRELEGTHLRRDGPGLSARGPHSEKAEYLLMTQRVLQLQGSSGQMACS